MSEKITKREIECKFQSMYTYNRNGRQLYEYIIDLFFENVTRHECVSIACDHVSAAT